MKVRKIKISFLLFFILLLPISNLKSQTLENVIISEILHGKNNCKTCEFIELYNLTENDIDLKKLIGDDRIRIFSPSGFTQNRKLSWKNDLIKSKGYFLIVSDDYKDLLDLADATFSSALSEKSGIQITKNNGQEILDQVSFFDYNVSLDQSLERNLQTNQFFIQDCPNPTNSKEETFNFCLQSNSISATPSQSIPPSFQSFSQPLLTPSFQVLPSDIVINEFVSDPIDGEEEWIELYNNTEKEIDLKDFYIEEGSGAQTFLNGKILPKGFFIIEKIKGYLNNDGDIIFLKDLTGKIIDKVTYGKWDDGNLNDNATNTKDPYSIARIIDGKDTNEDNLDFKVAKPTKGTPNQILNIENFVSGIVINEILPNPKGDDSEKEFIELKNLNDIDIDLENWYLNDSSGKKFTISSKKISTKIPKKGFLTIFRKDSQIALNNSGQDCLKIFRPDGTLIDSVCYSGECLEDVSFARNSKGEFEWTEILTPGAENEIKKPNQKPKAVIFTEKEKVLTGEEVFFDGSDSFDPDGDNLKFFWDFGDGNKKEGAYVSHIFLKPKKYKVTLKIEDGRGATDSASITIEVLKKKAESFSFADLSGKIFISEIFPNPKGKDDQEFIEIFNSSNEEIDLSNFILTDKTEKYYEIKEGTKIKPKDFLVFWKKDTKISLNNEEDEVRILNPEKELIDRVFYFKALENFSLSRKENGEIVWTSILTPGKKNEFLNEKSGKLEKEENLDKEEKTEKEGLIKEVKLKEIKSLKPKEKVKTIGIISVPPGVFQENIFYLSGSGARVKINFGQIPELKPGQEVQVLGEIFEEEGEKGIEVSSKEDIKILTFKSPPLPKELKIEDVNEDFLSSLVKIEGRVSKIKDNFIWLNDKDKEVLIILKNNFNRSFREGDFLRVVGILRKFENQFIVFPREEKDLESFNLSSLKSFTSENLFPEKKLITNIIWITILILGGLLLFKKVKL